MRCALHFGLIASVLAAFAQAPFQHWHEGRPGHEHAAGFVHAHWEFESPENPAWEEIDGDGGVRLLEWLTGAGKSHFTLDVEVGSQTVEPVALTSLERIRKATYRSHDPPWATPLHPRPPPA